MLYLFVLFIIIFLLWPLLKTGWRIWSQMRNMRRFMQDPEGEMRRRASKNEGNPFQGFDFGVFGSYGGFGREGAQKRRRPRKKIPRDVGEYVQFTEVELSKAERERYYSAYASERVYNEQQVSDIKWVDIK